MQKRLSIVATALILMAVLVGCATAPPAPAAPPEPVIPEASKDVARQADVTMVEAQLKTYTDQLDRTEADVKKAAEMALGQVPVYPGAPKPYPASQAYAELKKAKVKLYFEPVLDAQGKPVADQFVQLKDSLTDKMPEIGRKMQEGKATAKEKRYMQNAAKYATKLNDLKAQTNAATRPAMQAGWMVASGSMTTMSTVGMMIQQRRQLEMEWTDKDFELVRVVLELQSRREGLAAISLGMLAGYRAVLEGNGDPKVLDDIAKATLESVPFKGKATLDDAKRYVGNFNTVVDVSQKIYEAQMIKTYGEAHYNARFKGQIDAHFMRMRAATTAMTATERLESISKKYREDLQKCARGEDPGYASMVGPDKCKEAKSKADGSGALSAAALEALAGGPKAKDESSALDSLLHYIPGGDSISTALEAVQAIQDGNYGKAMKLAADLVPLPGPAKSVLTSAARVVSALEDKG